MAIMLTSLPHLNIFCKLCSMGGAKVVIGRWTGNIICMAHGWLCSVSVRAGCSHLTGAGPGPEPESGTRHPATAGHLQIQLPSTGLNPPFRHSTVEFIDITNNIYSIHRNANTLISIVGINPLKYSGPMSRRIPCRHQRSWSSQAKHQVCIIWETKVPMHSLWIHDNIQTGNLKRHTRSIHEIKNENIILRKCL